MKGDLIILPFSGTRRVHHWEPSPQKQYQPRPAVAIKPPIEGTMRSRILDALKSAPDGLTCLDLCGKLLLSKSPASAMLFSMTQKEEIEITGTRKSGVRLARVYRIKP